MAPGASIISTELRLYNIHYELQTGTLHAVHDRLEVLHDIFKDMDCHSDHLSSKKLPSVVKSKVERSGTSAQSKTCTSHESVDTR